MPTLQHTLLEGAETYTRLAVAAKAVALQDHQRMLADHAQRVRDSHSAMMRAAGFDATLTAEEDMGAIVIGDTNIYGSQQAPAAPASAAAAPQGTGATDWLKKAAVATALVGAGVGGGVGVPWYLGMFDKAPAASTGLELPGGYELIIVPEEPVK